jgi:soluble lytic murein transglycosylase-like protein
LTRFIHSLSFATAAALLALCGFSSPASAETIVRSYARALQSFNPNLSDDLSEALAQRVIIESNHHRLDARLIVALVATESAWRPRARSPVGATGLGQLMPGTAADLAVDPNDPDENVRGTVRYLAGLVGRYRGLGLQEQYQRAIAAYNAGPGAVDRYRGIPPYSETQNYVRAVITEWRRLCGL